VYDAIGGDEAFVALARAFHLRCLDDPVLNHPFSHPGQHPQHVERLAAYWAEVLGGPPRFSEGMNDHSAMLSMHAGMGAGDDMPERFRLCFAAAQDDAGVPADPRLRAVLAAYMRWATDEVHRYNDRGSVVPGELRMPHWSWDGLQP
jgi:hemoglobin